MPRAFPTRRPRRIAPWLRDTLRLAATALLPARRLDIVLDRIERLP